MEQDVLNLLNMLGRDLTLTKKGAGNYTAENGIGTVTSDDHTVRGMLVNYSDRARANTLILEKDRKALLAAKGMTIEPGNTDLITEDTTVYSIINVQKIVRNSTVIAYICQVRV